ncbi:MAG: S9 family peptidase, partial [Chloroflexi bacterium]|nr:S9 family peptidase [Chloroflexota bacterium]
FCWGGVMNVWVGSLDAIEEARPVTEDKGSGIRIHFWTYNPCYVMYLQDRDGDENWHAYVVNVETGESRDLTPFDGVQAIPKESSPKFPDEVLIAINNREPRLHDLYRVNILTGASELIVKNDFGAADIMSDRDLRPRLAAVLTPDGGSDVLSFSESGERETTMRIDVEDDITTWPLYFDVDGRILYVYDSRGRDTSALMAVDTETGEVKELAVAARVDVGETIQHPVTGRPQAVGFEYERLGWKVLDDSIAADIDQIDDKDKGDFNVRSRTLEDRKWLIEYVKDDRPKTYYLYEREKRELQYLFSDRPELESASLASMCSAIVKSRDGLDLMVYYTLPVGSTIGDPERPSSPLPMVLRVHGGPTGRDSWGYDDEHQLLANRGYAVLSVNFRGSTGFGKGFTNAGNLEWGGAMHDDLIDAVAWAVEEGIADPDRVAIMGGSYGGYAVLVGLTFTPEVFACGVDMVGISNLNTFLDNVPPYWKPIMTHFRIRVGDNKTEEGRRFLAERSPISRVDSFVRPLLIGQGANDPRVTQAESDQIVDAMKDRGIPVTYLLYPDEGHGFARPENNLSYMAVAEAFLAKCLGGKYEPIGDDFQGSSVQVLEGAGDVPGLAEELAIADSTT